MRRSQPAALGAEPFTINDVSILFPPPREKDNDSFYLGLNSANGDAALIKETDFNSLFQAAQHPSVKLGESLKKRVAKVDSWKVVGMRIDPCSKQTSTSACSPQIRLVAHPLLASEASEKSRVNSTLFFADFGLHLIYDISQDSLKAAVKKLRELKESNTKSTQDLPLDVHPSFLGNNGESFAKRVQTFIQTFASSSNLSHAAFLNAAAAVTGDQPFQWSLTAFSFSSGKPKIFPVPNSSENVMRFFLAEGDGPSGIVPKPVGAIAQSKFSTTCGSAKTQVLRKRAFLQL